MPPAKKKTPSEIFSQFNTPEARAKFLNDLSVARKPKKAEAASSSANADVYLRNLKVLQTGLRASAAGLINPAIQSSIAKILSERGLATDELGKALASGALTIPTTEANTIAGTVATELSEFQSAIRASRAGVPKAPSQVAGAITGAVSGFAATGSPIGAVVGGLGGLLNARQGGKSTKAANRALDEAAKLASPETFQANLNRATAAAREETFVSGQQAQLAQESAISAGGLRGTGIGTQASIGAAVAPSVAALRRAAGISNVATGLGVNERLQSPVRPPSTTLVDLLAAGSGTAFALLSPAEKAKRLRNRPITGGTSFTDTIGSNIVQPTVGDIS